MVQISISIKPPKIATIKPYRLIDQLSIGSRQTKIDSINTVFSSIKRWAHAERNYSS